MGNLNILNKTIGNPIKIINILDIYMLYNKLTKRNLINF